MHPRFEPDSKLADLSACSVAGDSPNEISASGAHSDFLVFKEFSTLINLVIDASAQASLSVDRPPPPIPKYCRQPSNVSDSSGNPRRRRYPQTSHPPTVSTTCRTSSFSPTSHQIRSSLGLGLHQELQLQYKSPLGLTIRNRRRTPSSFVVVADQGISDHISSSSCGAFRMIRRAVSTAPEF